MTFFRYNMEKITSKIINKLDQLICIEENLEKNILKTLELERVSKRPQSISITKLTRQLGSSRWSDYTRYSEKIATRCKIHFHVRKCRKGF